MVFPITTSKSEDKETQNPKNVYHIGGLQVKFPYEPYGTQLAFMSRVISTLDRAQRDGRCHALLESPTGTGKTLSLLCSVLAWQQSYKSRFPKGNLAHRRSLFIPETQPLSTEPSNLVEVELESPTIPTIFYASRTHAQISQVIREYRKTAYRVPMAVLGARKRSCTNCHVQGKPNVDEKCRSLLKDTKSIKCREFLGKDAIVDHPSLKHNEVHDIEDLVKIGKTVRGCPYYASWTMYQGAQLVFCPYSYIVDQLIREKLFPNVKGAIIIFDEAHNMEDIAREAGSIDLGEETLFKLQSELQLISLEMPEIYQPVCDVVDGLICWIGRKKDSLAKRDPQHYFSSWTGDKALRELEESNITRESFSNISMCINKAISTSDKAQIPHLSGISVSTLKELLTTLGYLFSRNGSQILDYELGLQRFIKRARDSSGTTWTHTLSLWCMNPSVVFKDLVQLSSSIILTSGTLSPMDSFSSELGMQFGACLEAPHVVDANQQVWAAGIFSGPNNQPLNASYKTAGEYPFQDALGKSLEEICSIVPGGSLVFFPSYKLMEKLCSRWRETGQWSRLCFEKDIFIEPRGGATGEFENVLKGYYDCIRGKKRLTGRNRRGGTQDDSKNGGAAFLAVCRGKVSEGLDFTDDNARAVIIVGIPFPNLHDVLVELKRSYNDTYKSSKNLLGGGEWYCQQAYRALNQAAGRCIRHRFDYGAIIFLDERYRQQRNRVSISKWLRQNIKLYDNFEESTQGLKSFFHSAKKHVDSKMLSHKEVIDLECVVQTEPETSFLEGTSGCSASSPFSCSSCLTLGSTSVNSHALKRRKFTSSAAIYIDLEKENNHDMITRRIEFGSEPRSGNHMYGSKRVQISCLLCRSPLGHPDNGSLYLNCLVTWSSKKYLLSLLNETSRSEMPTSISILVTDCSLVDQRLCTRGEGIWCEQDGCVFNTIFCPFCTIPSTCLGVQIMAADSSNIHFLSKIFFFPDHLNVMDEAETLLEHKVLDREVDDEKKRSKQVPGF